MRNGWVRTLSRRNWSAAILRAVVSLEWERVNGGRVCHTRVRRRASGAMRVRMGVKGKINLSQLGIGG